MLMMMMLIANDIMMKYKLENIHLNLNIIFFFLLICLLCYSVYIEIE